MLHFLLLRPVAVLMSAFGLVALGVVSLRMLPVSLLPDVPIPEVSVQVSYPNTSARELENVVVMPLRNQLLQVGKLRDIRSQSRNGGAVLVLEFDFGTNTDLAFIEVNEKIDQAMDYLPRELERPRVIKANVSDIPVFYLSVVPKILDSLSANARTQALLELSEFTRIVLKRRLEQLPQIAFVDVSGYAEPEVVITPDAATLQSLGLTERDLELLLQQNNLSLGSIVLQENQYQYNVRFLSSLSSVQDIEQISFNHRGRVLQLGEIANIQLQMQSRQGLYLHNAKESVVFSIYKQADAQLFDLKKDFDELLIALQKDYPQLDFYISNDQSELLAISINNLLSSLGYGTLFAFVVVLLFFREWRLPLLIGLTVPISLIIGFLGFYLLDISINIISLAGLILGVGLLVDNSIIVIENIRQQRRMGLTLAKACVVGGNEVIRPLISSVLTTCAIFLPLIFLSGIAGALFYDQAVSITIVLFTSLIAAYILIPVLVNVIEAKRNDLPKTGNNSSSNRKYLYNKVIGINLKTPLLSILIFTGVIVSIYWLILKIPKEGFPQLTRDALEMKIDWNEPINALENERRVKALLESLQNGLNATNAFVGEQQFLLLEQNQTTNEAILVLYFSIDTPETIISKINQYCSRKFPKATFSIAPLKNIFDEIFGGARPALIAHIQSVKSQQTPSPEEVASLLARLQEQQITYELLPQQEVYSIAILKERALQYDVSYEFIYSKLQTLLGQHASGTMKMANAYIPIFLSAAERNFNELLETATVENQKRQALPLKFFIRLEKQTDAKIITANKSGEALELKLPNSKLEEAEKIRQNAEQHGNLSITFSGQLFENQKLIKEVSLVGLISLVLLYFILAAQFESLLQPIIVLLTVPVGIGGAFGLLLLSGQSLNLISLIGLVVMAGIGVNDAILKVDTINRLIKIHSLKEAIHIAGERRLNAIIMTSLTTILALMPVLFSAGLGAELQQPLAYAIIGGLTMTTIASIYFIPVLYLLIYKLK